MEKFQVLRLGNKETLKNETYIFSPGYSEVIECKEAVKNLKIMVDQRLNLWMQRQRALDKV